MQSFSILSVVLFLLIIIVYFYPSDGLEFKYHTNQELEVVLKKFDKNTKNINTHLYSIGNSTKGVPLWVMELNGSKKYDPRIPNIKFVANIHGNEALGRELLLHFMEYLRDNYEKNEEVKCLLDNTRVHLLPSMNPDGFAKAVQDECIGRYGRNNEMNEDLNRNFPDFYHPNPNIRQPETEAVMRWMDSIPFILSAGLHGGAMVANYPFDTVKVPTSSRERPPSLTPDEDVFKYLATTYAKNHPKMTNGRCEDDEDQHEFPTGITNGAAWYPLFGGMQDYNYIKGCMEVTLELSCCKYPRPGELKKLWEQNRESLMQYSLLALRGVAGRVLDSEEMKPITNASLEIVGRNMEFFTSQEGFFWRILLDGHYKLKVKSPGYHTQIVDFEVREQHLTGCPIKKPLMILLINSTIRTTPRAIKPSTIQPLLAKRHTRNQSSDLQARILNKPGINALPPIPKEEETRLFNMVFGLPPKTNSTVTEDDVMNLMNTTDSTSFDAILKDFNKKNESEKAKVVLQLTTEKMVRNHMKNGLNITDFSPYEHILRNYDEKSVSDKKLALKQLLERYNLEKDKKVKSSGFSLHTYKFLVNVSALLFTILKIHLI